MSYQQIINQPDLFGSFSDDMIFIDKTHITNDLNVFSIMIKWGKLNLNNEHNVIIYIQEEYGNIHNVGTLSLKLDDNFRLIYESFHDKYGNNFNVTYDMIYTYVRYLAGCHDWNDINSFISNSNN